MLPSKKNFSFINYSFINEGIGRQTERRRNISRSEEERSLLRSQSDIAFSFFFLVFFVVHINYYNSQHTAHTVVFNCFQMQNKITKLWSK